MEFYFKLIDLGLRRKKTYFKQSKVRAGRFTHTHTHMHACNNAWKRKKSANFVLECSLNRQQNKLKVEIKSSERKEKKKFKAKQKV